jgi:hypothetical protein
MARRLGGACSDNHSLIGAVRGRAQEYFEGQTVSPKLAMPGTEDGVDIHPGTARPLDPKYASRLKQYGIAIKPGEPVTVTKLKVKSKHIEFQLGGGGYGTFGDETSSKAKKRAMKEELDDLKADRERENERNRANVAEAEEHRKQNVRQRRLEGGSRFNIRYPNGVPAEALTPEAVTTALAQYLDFGQAQATATARAATPSNPLQPAAAGPSKGSLPRKGMLLSDVEALLGPAAAVTDRKEGTLRVQSREYPSSDGRISAEFVEGVLIRYRVASE